MLNKDRVCAFVLLIIAHHELDVLALPTKNRPALLYIACVYLLLLGSSHPFSDGPSRILSSGVHYRYARNDSSISPLNNSVAGAVQIGVILSYALFGVTTTQAYTYYCRFPGDPRMLKALVSEVTAIKGSLNLSLRIGGVRVVRWPAYFDAEIELTAPGSARYRPRYALGTSITRSRYWISGTQNSFWAPLPNLCRPPLFSPDLLRPAVRENLARMTLAHVK
jgi:hypothetical protein